MDELRLYQALKQNAAESLVYCWSKYNKDLLPFLYKTINGRFIEESESASGVPKIADPLRHDRP